MIVKELLNPDSIVVVGASNDITKPGGRVLKHILEGEYDGQLFAVNPKEDVVQGIKCFKTVSELEKVDLAIIAIAAKFTLETVEILAKEKGTKAFIILSAGFSETGNEGKILEEKIVEVVNSVNGTLIGPNCVGVLTPRYKGSFTGPIPKLKERSVDFVSGSGATAVFIMEAAIPMGLSFASLFSVGNSAQIGVEEVLEYWDENHNPDTSSLVKLIYIEQISNPQKLLKHCRSLIKKGCSIAAIKAGTTDAGSRAVSSHTGALAGSDTAVDALFKKAGIIRCFSRQELVYTAAALSYKKLTGKNLAVITHAGGPGVMLTDTLSEGGFNVPHITGKSADELLTKLFPGSSVANPIDFLATGTAEQLGIILDYVDNYFDNIDGSIVIYGTPGLFDVTNVYELLNEKMKKQKKPIYPVLPSLIQAKDAVKTFISFGRCNFPDEVLLGRTLCRIYNSGKPLDEEILPSADTKKIREIISNSKPGYLQPKQIQGLLDAVGIPRAGEAVVNFPDDLKNEAQKIGYPIVMKAVGPVHKSDVSGVALNIQNEEQALSSFQKLIEIPETTAVLIQPMLKGTELFVGAKFEENFGHLILCGLGGIFIEVLKDISYGLSPVGINEATAMIKSLKSYKLIEGTRGKEGVNEEKFAEIIVKLSVLLNAAPEILELDINPLLGTKDSVTAVDARIRI
ncbi:CoA-binding protein [Bacteroidetes/Chlorobi group bacterium ChocPot_Mid]|nr:MAG: CoA-binding protein [Bacteroidetes/Chlorobi group bacterium ChocPot_Mid]